MKKEGKIVDTNVLIVANGVDTHIDYLGQEKCINFLKNTRENNFFVIDNLSEILLEYSKKCKWGNVPYGNLILKYIKDNQFNPEKVIEVPVTRSDFETGDTWYSEINSLLLPPLNTDTSDRKFLAVHHGSNCRYPIVNATDGDWGKLQKDMIIQGIDSNLLIVEELLI